MTLKSYYESLEREIPPKTALIKELADECNVNEATVRNWILYGIKPREERYKEIISKKTNIPIDELW